MSYERRSSHNFGNPRGFAFAALVAVAVCFFHTASDANAARKPDYGRIEISTNPGGFPIVVDGKPFGTSTANIQMIDLPPGQHTVEVTFPNGSRWVREFNIGAGRRNCIVLNYRPKTTNITKSPCPYPVNVSAPGSVREGDIVTFTSDVNYPGSTALNYTWTISPAAARILSGAGTPTITVDSTGLGNQSLTAILVVDDGSGDRACRQTSQATTGIAAPAPPPIQPRRFVEFPSISFDDDKANLDNFAIELQNTPDAQGYVFVYGGRTSRVGQADRLGARARDYLVTVRGVDSSRVVVVNGGYRDRDYLDLWIVPRGAQAPQPTPTVQPSDVRPGPDVRSRPLRRRRRS